MPVLLSSELLKTCTRLHQRIHDRFPDAGLATTCDKLIAIAQETDQTIAWIRRPNYFIRITAWLVIGLMIASLARSWFALKITITGMNAADFFQMIDAGFNSIVLLGAAWVFLTTFEIKRKRKRIVSAVNKLKCIAHIVDAHQLTKDPQSMSEKRTEHSPERTLSEYDLGRYLDYCSEMLSIASKVAFLYVQNFDDPIANQEVNDLEAVTVGLSQKIWQKIVMIQRDRISKLSPIGKEVF
jgi:hypothetical protein